jgi:hypothetical protein
VGTFDAASVSGGAVSVVGGKLRFTPASGFDGTDTFTYRVKDAQGQESAPATVTVTVTPSPSPTASPTSAATASPTPEPTTVPPAGPTPEPAATATPDPTPPAGGGGLPGVGPDGAALPDEAAPVLSSLKLRKRKLTFTSSEAGTVTIVIRKGRKRATIKVSVVEAVKTTVNVPRKFRKGRLKLKLTAMDAAGNQSAALAKRLKLKP